MSKAWPIKTLAEVCLIKPPKSEARDRVPSDALVSFAPMEDLGIGQKLIVPTQTKPLSNVVGSYTYFAEGDVLLAKITPCFENGKLGIASGLTNGIGFGSSEYVVFRPHASLSREWLYHFLDRESFRTEGAARMTGAVGHKRVSKEYIEACPIPLPPIPEQQRIVGILDEAFAGIATAKTNAEKNLQNARALFESHLHAVFNRTSDLVPLSELASDVTDGDHMPPPKAPTGVPFITIGDIVKSTREIDFEHTFRVSQEYFDSLKPNRRPRRGDVLYTVTGATLGIPVLVTDDREFCFQRHIGLIRPKPNVNSSWLCYAMLSPQVFSQATNGSTGAAQKTVSLSVLRKIQIPRAPLPEQRRITARLDTLQTETRRLEALYAKKLAALDELKSALLHQAFSGQL